MTADPLTDRLPPQNRDAERGVLGGILRDPEILSDVLAVVGPEQMYFDAHRRVLSALTAIASRGEPIDLVSLRTELRRRKELDEVGGDLYLADLWEAVPTGANAGYHAKLVREAAMVRGLIHASNETLRDAYDATGSAEDMLTAAERRLYELNTTAGGDEPHRLSDTLRRSVEDLEERIARGEAITGLSTGFEDVDGFGGWRDGDLIVLAARPSVGKTALAQAFVMKVLARLIPVLFFSLEMSEREITDRFLSMESGVPLDLMGKPRELNDEAIGKIAAAQARLNPLPLLIDDRARTAAQVASVARRACRKHGVRLIVVDYLGLMSPENPKANKSDQIGKLAHRMKDMARDLKLPVLLLAQLNRDVEQTNRRPKLSDLRDSGEIEQHADRVILLHRESNLPMADPVWPIELIFAKNRNGPIGDMKLAYRRPVVRFENCAVGY